jgi:hypothetical protein
MTPPIIPNSNVPLVDNTGRITTTWQVFLGALIGPPAAIAVVPVSASPTSYTASARGTVGISGGTLTSVTLTRSGVSINLGATRTVPVANNDLVTVVYTAAPTIKFIPG